MERRPLVISWGEILWDLFPDEPRLGGCAANVAFHLAQLGTRASLVSRLGEDALGDRALRELRASSVEVDLVQRDAQMPTGTVRVEIEQGEPRFSMTDRAAWDRIEWSEAIGVAIAAADVFCFGTLAQRTQVGSDSLRRAWSAGGPRTRLVCDVNLLRPHPTRAVVEDSLRAADVVKLNESEREWLRDLFGVRDPIGWMLGELGVEMVALTRGEHGCVLFGGDRPPVRAVPERVANAGDRVGAGDAFTATLCALLPVGRDLEQIAEVANRVAAHVATQTGAMPRLPEALRLFA